MTTATFTSRQFNQDTGRAKKAASNGPVFITDRGKPMHVLLSIEEYNRLAGGRKSMAELFGMPGDVDVELEIPGFPDVPRVPDLLDD